MKKLKKVLKEVLTRKDVTVLLWVVVSNGIIAGLSLIASNPDLYDPKWVGLANVILVSVLKRELK